MSHRVSVIQDGAKPPIVFGDDEIWDESPGDDNIDLPNNRCATNICELTPSSGAPMPTPQSALTATQSGRVVKHPARYND